MNWKLKALAQNVLSRMPYASSFNYLGQVFITRSHAHLDRSVLDRLNKARWFLEVFSLHSGLSPTESHFYEFGAGWHLAGPLSLYGLGVGRQTVIDITPCVRISLVNKVIDILGKLPAGEFRRCERIVRSLDDLEKQYGIRYQAPLDGRSTGFANASVDCITSTFTMEHIPKEDLRAILRECFRVLKPGAVICALIDYQDHYAYHDSAISVYNFLQYSERDWQRFNSSLHFQNRMRHSQYVDLFNEAGFQIKHEEVNNGSTADRDVVKSLHLADEFRRFPEEDLVIRSSKLVAVKDVTPAVGARSRSEHHAGV
jgi:SAM-dependent methyltransferase